MATATVTVSVPDIRYDVTGLGNQYEVTGTLAVQANPATYVTGGLPTSLSHPLIKSQRPPIFVNITSLNGFQYYFVPGTTISNGFLKIFTGDGVELGNGVAIPAGNSGDTITFQARFFGQN